MTVTEADSPVTVRCMFCDQLNRVDLARAADRPTCGECGKPILLDRPVKVSEADFTQTVEGSRAPVLVDFYADWCPPCRVLDVQLRHLAATHDNLAVRKIDILDWTSPVVEQHGVTDLPHMVLYGPDGERLGSGVEVYSLVARLFGTSFSEIEIQ